MRKRNVKPAAASKGLESSWLDPWVASACLVQSKNASAHLSSPTEAIPWGIKFRCGRIGASCTSRRNCTSRRYGNTSGWLYEDHYDPSLKKARAHGNSVATGSNPRHVRLLRAAGLSETGPCGAIVHQSIQLYLVDSGHQVERYAASLEVLRQISE
jgi:hypothetical protein